MSNFCDACRPINDKKFYIYLTIVVLIIIIGSSYIFSNEEIKNITWVLILWILVNLVYLIMFYSFMKIQRLNQSLVTIYLTNFLFIILLILQLIWAIEIKKMNKHDLNIPIIIIMIISIGIGAIAYNNRSMITFCSSIIYVMLWLYIIYAYSLCPE